MDMRVHVAVLLVTDAHTSADEGTVKLVIERLGAAGHAVVECAIEKDSQQLVRAHFLRWIADAEVDVVIAVAGVDTEATVPALAPSITKKLEGFSDLFRMISFEEIGTGAMLVDATAAQCGSTFVFVLPASNGAVKSAIDKIIVPQLDHRTRPRNLATRMPRLRDAVARMTHLRTNEPGASGVPVMIPKEDTEVAGVPPPARGERRPAAPDQPADASLTAPVTTPLKPVLVHPRSGLDSQANVSDSATAATRKPRSPTSPGERALAAVWGTSGSEDSGAISSGTPKAVEANPTVQTSSPPPPGPPPPGPPGNRHPRPKTEPSSPPPLSRPTAAPLAFVKARLEGTTSSSTTVPTRTPVAGIPSVKTLTPGIGIGAPAISAAAAAAAAASTAISAPATSASSSTTTTSGDVALVPAKSSAEATSSTESKSPASTTTESKSPPATTTSTAESTSPTSAASTSTAESTSPPATTTSTAESTSPTSAASTSTAESKSPATTSSTESKSPSTTTESTSTTESKSPATTTESKSPATTTSSTPVESTSPTSAASTSSTPVESTPAAAAAAADTATTDAAAKTTPSKPATPATGTATASPPTRPHRPTPPPPPPIALRQKTTSTNHVGTAVERPTNGKSALADDDVPLLEADLDPSASSSGILPVRRPARDDDSDTTIPTRGERALTDKRALARRRKSKLPFVIIGIALLASSALVIAGMNRDKEPAATAPVTTPTLAQTPPPPAPEPAPTPTEPTPAEVTPPIPTEGSATEGSATDPVPTDPPVDPAPVDPAPVDPPPSDVAPGKKKPRVAAADPKTPKVKEPKEPKPAVVPEPREGGCDEVSCVMDKYARACCAKYKPADPGYKPQIKPTGGNGELPGTLDKTMIRTGTAKVKGAIIECGVKANAKGTVKVSVNVGADGRVSSSSVVSSPDDGLGDCVAAAIRKATYARTANGGTFTYPFVF